MVDLTKIECVAVEYHKCLLCDEWIYPNDRYNHAQLNTDDVKQYFRIHIACDHILDLFKIPILRYYSSTKYEFAKRINKYSDYILSIDKNDKIKTIVDKLIKIDDSVIIDINTLIMADEQELVAKQLEINEKRKQPVVLVDVVRKCNKPHICSLCGGSIRKGVKYRNIETKLNKVYGRIAIHIKCDDIARIVNHNIYSKHDRINKSESFRESMIAYIKKSNTNITSDFEFYDIKSLRKLVKPKLVKQTYVRKLT